MRKTGEYTAGHIEHITHKPLAQVHTGSRVLDPKKTYHLHCAGGYRSLIYASIARSKGVKQVVNVQGGYAAIKKAEVKTLKFTS